MKKILLLLLIIVLSISIGTLIINEYIINSTKNKIIDIHNISDDKDVDAILVLGCKVYDYGPSLMLSKRLDKAYDVYQKKSVKLLLSGDHGTNNYDEVNIMKNYLLNNDISEGDIFLDHAGFSTYDSLYRAKHVFGISKVIIVTQRYHIYRALYLANKLQIDAVGVVADDIPQKGIMLKNEIREVLSRDKSFFMGIIKPKSKYIGEKISLGQNGEITNG